MARAPVKKMEVQKAVPKKPALNYFKLPFEIYYSGAVNVIQGVLKSDIKPKNFKDIKVLHIEEGRAFGVSLSCEENNGPELCCCLTNGHDEATPPWLALLEDEEEVDFNYGCNYAVIVDGDEVLFKSLTDEQQDEDSEEYLDANFMNNYWSDSFLTYSLQDADIDYIILDANKSRVKIDAEGYELDKDGERIGTNQIIDVESLECNKYGEAVCWDLYDAKADWINGVIKSDFPKESRLKLSVDTE